jgi:hypothetical protein
LTPDGQDFWGAHTAYQKGNILNTERLIELGYNGADAFPSRLFMKKPREALWL